MISWIVCCLSPQLSQWRSFPNSAPLASVYVKFFGQEIAFANIDKNLIDQVIAVLLKFTFMNNSSVHFFYTRQNVTRISALQLAAIPKLQTAGKDIIRAVLSGVSLQIAKPLLATEIRRILPTAAGLPMELSLYTAAVAAAAVRGM